MEQCAVVISLLHQFHEIVTVDGRLVIQANHDVAQHCLNLYFHIICFICFLRIIGTCLADSLFFELWSKGTKNLGHNKALA